MNQAVKRVKEYSGVLSAGLAVVMTMQVEGSGGRIDQCFGQRAQQVRSPKVKQAWHV